MAKQLLVLTFEDSQSDALFLLREFRQAEFELEHGRSVKPP